MNRCPKTRRSTSPTPRKLPRPPLPPLCATAVPLGPNRPGVAFGPPTDGPSVGTMYRTPCNSGSAARTAAIDPAACPPNVSHCGI
jgi:hypothetical protein